MKLNFAKVQFLLLFLFLSPQVFSSGLDSIPVILSMPNVEMKTSKDLTIVLTIRSNQQKVLEIPKGGLWGYASEGAGFFSIQVQRKINEKYQDIKGIARMDNPPEVSIDSLRTNDFREFKFPIALLYHYQAGAYRIRVLCHFSTLNPIIDTFSNWVHFHCAKEILPE